MVKVELFHELVDVVGGVETNHDEGGSEDDGSAPGEGGHGGGEAAGGPHTQLPGSQQLVVDGYKGHCVRLVSYRMLHSRRRCTWVRVWRGGSRSRRAFSASCTLARNG